jgi:ribonuclease H2 subunit A
MLRIPSINLNKQAQEATVLLIREVLDRGITLSEVGFFSGVSSGC